MGRSESKRALKREQKKLEKLAKLDAQRPVLPEAVAQNPSLPEFLDGTNYQLILSQYNHKECEIADLVSKEVEALIKKLSRITETNQKTIGSSGIIRDNIAKDGQYKSLFAGLEEDIELKEAQFFGDARIFFYLVNSQPHGETYGNYCCIVAVKKQHIETR